MSKASRMKLSVLVAGMALAVSAGLGLAQEGPAAKVGEVLEGTGRAIKRGVQGAGATVREGFARTRTSVHNMEVVSRVYSRLHWDKALTAATLDMEVQAGGVVVLRGVVPDDDAKQKAVALAADTVGVIQVVDQLSLALPTRVIRATPAPKR